MVWRRLRVCCVTPFQGVYLTMLEISLILIELRPQPNTEAACYVISVRALLRSGTVVYLVFFFVTIGFLSGKNKQKTEFVHPF